MLSDHGPRTAAAPQPGRVTRSRLSFVALAGLVLLVGCTSSSSQTSSIFGGLLGPPLESPGPTGVSTPAPPERTGECDSAAQCQHVLKTMIDSPDRGWIGQRQSPDKYANGTRLFAYRALRKQLTCGELTLAVDELAAASKSLGGAVSGMSHDQVSRTRDLCSQVAGELAKERQGRCRT